MKHPSLHRLLSERFAEAITRIAGEEHAGGPAVRPAADAKFGDYQCNAAMALARPLKSKPRDVAQRIVEAVDLQGIAERLEIAGPGFINIHLRDGFLADYLHEIPRPGEADRFGIPPADAPRRIVIDYSSPNIAKQMHVGHLRSTVIGDVFARVLGFLGHDVVRQNHVGDWGTAMGMVILGLWYIGTRLRRGESIEVVRGRLATLTGIKEASIDARREALAPIAADWSQDLARVELDQLGDLEISLEDLELGYKFVQTLTTLATGTGCTVFAGGGEGGDELAAVPRIVTKMLQEGGEQHASERAAWREACRISLDYCQHLYDRLGVLLTRDDVCGESFYDNRLAPVVAEVRSKLAKEDTAEGGRAAQTHGAIGDARVECREDAGAVCLYFYNDKGEPRFKNPDSDALPMIIQKSDGAFLYASTDLAAIRYRIEELAGRRLIYVTDARQKLHFEMLFTAAGAMGWACDDVALEHTTFGSVLGEDRKPLKTRSGENVKLGELLDEAERRAHEILETKQRQRQEEAAARAGDDEIADETTLNTVEKRDIARRIGVAAVKYADLSRDRNSDYVFSWDKMLALQGNTAPYMMYAYARIRSIYRKAAERFGEPDVYADGVSLTLADPAERALALRLARLAETVETLGGDLLPHSLCSYLYDLAADFMRFYEACPVLRAADEPTRQSRMRLCDLTARALRLGLGLLGIDVIERM